jgi:LAS superfamily LD-carboxypeptidase LdcB
MPTTTTSKLTTHNPKPTTTSKQTVKPAPRPTGDAKIEVKNGITYVNGILIANKTYPIPASYNPGLNPQAQAAFNKMQQAAAMQGINLWICSGFRSYSYQSQLYNNYVAVDGKAAADRYSARPGYSEHQTGLAMDINYASSYFDNTPEAKWLAAHCSDYGFIIRYKAGKESSTGYMAESWHIRYLGDVALCKSIEASGLSLEEYLGITSVYANP